VSARESKAAAGLLPYLPALDGLRAVAIAGVLLYHAGLAWAPGGFLGVEVFFVVSGYLITSLLLAEWRQHGRIAFTAFWLRRARRLLPALFLLIAVTLAFAVVFLPDEVAGLRGDTLAALGYVTNWYLIFSHKPYFEAVGRPPVLQHLWSLAVEEQFYLLWPLLFAAGMRFPTIPKGGCALGGFAVSGDRSGVRSDPRQAASKSAMGALRTSCPRRPRTRSRSPSTTRPICAWGMAARAASNAGASSGRTSTTKRHNDSE